MKRYFTLLMMAILSLGVTIAYSQCEPDIAGCPDPEGNGEICPDTLFPAALNQAYAEVITILVPDSNMGVKLHHITLVDVQNMPTGLTWQSNSPGNEFYPEEYYCILMEGTPTIADTFYLKIIVDVYIDFAGIAVYAGQQIDSTSVYMEVVDPFGIKELPGNEIYITSNSPNPFRGSTEISYSSATAGEITFEVYSVTGQLKYSSEIRSSKGLNSFTFDAGTLAPGIYLYRLKGNRYSATSRMMIER